MTRQSTQWQTRRTHRLLGACGFQRVATVGLFLSLSAPALRAHDFWIEPSAFRPREGALVGLRLMVGENLLGDPVPRDSASVERFVVTSASGERSVPGREGGSPAGILRVEEPGLLTVAYQSRPHALDLPPDKFEQYLGEEGLDAVKAIVVRSKTNARVARERFSRCAKVLIASGTPAPADRDRAVGMRLELVARRNPYLTAPGQDLPVVLLYEGKPLPGALVIAQNGSDSSVTLRTRSDKQGRATFRLPRGGSWLIRAVHMIPAAPGAGVDWESFWASLMFELPAGESQASAR